MIYYSVVRPIIMKAKKLDIEQFSVRNDYKHTFMMIENDENDIENLMRANFKIKGGNRVQTVLLLDKIRKH